MLAGLTIDPQVASYLRVGIGVVRMGRTGWRGGSTRIDRRTSLLGLPSCWATVVGAEFEELFGLKKTFTYRANNFSTTSFVQVFYLPWWHLVSQFNVNRGHKK